MLIRGLSQVRLTPSPSDERRMTTDEKGGPEPSFVHRRSSGSVKLTLTESEPDPIFRHMERNHSLQQDKPSLPYANFHTDRCKGLPVCEAGLPGQRPAVWLTAAMSEKAEIKAGPSRLQPKGTTVPSIASS